jgi:hypothetical protein
MHIGRILLAAVGAFVAYFILGGAMFAALPVLKVEFQKFPGVYRDHDGQMSHFPVGMAGMLLSMVVLAVLYAMTYKSGYGLKEGAVFGVLIGLFALGSFVLHNYANLNIGWKITVYSGLAYMVEWIAVGVAIGLIYRPQ